jgi:phage regulator Rha-like protein
MNELSTETEQTTPSLEVAKLTEKERKNILRDIKKVLKEAGLDTSKFGCTYVLE